MVDELLDIDCGFLDLLFLLFEFTADYLLFGCVLHYFILQKCILCLDLFVLFLKLEYQFAESVLFGLE